MSDPCGHQPDIEVSDGNGNHEDSGNMYGLISGVAQSREDGRLVVFFPCRREILHVPYVRAGNNTENERDGFHLVESSFTLEKRWWVEWKSARVT